MSKSVHILVVDDEPDLELLVRQKFRRQIRQGELVFSFAGDGVEALERLEDDGDIDIVLSDINMPRMDGLSLLSKIRELERHLLKVVIVSAYGDMENIRTAMNRGAFDFITKPINFDDLELTIGRTYDEVETLRNGQRVQHQFLALHRELEIASKIQLSMLPSAYPAFPECEGFSLYATMIPAQEVGGDFYDCFMIDDDRLGFVLGDVSGKGVGAALFMAITRTMLRATALQGMAPHECIGRVNKALYPESMAHMFVTAIYGMLNVRSGDVVLCNAGHLHPIVLRADRTLEQVKEPRGIGLCLMSDFNYGSASIKLDRGDGILLYTDGVTEAQDEDREQFEDERLLTTLENAKSLAPAEVLRDVLRAVEEFSDGARQADDITLVALQYTDCSD